MGGSVRNSPNPSVRQRHQDVREKALNERLCPPQRVSLNLGGKTAPIALTVFRNGEKQYLAIRIALKVQFELI
jgi:hypothetical protein|tara:strand:- start:160 stop:378 length:219 start_codon:yes stop_codon:yes gene_type:complete